MNMTRHESISTVAHTRSLKSRPTLNPLFNSTSSRGTSYSGSSRQQSSDGHARSSEGINTRSETGWSVPLSTQTNTTHEIDTNINTSVTLQRKTTQDLISIFERKAPTNTSTDAPLASHSLHRGGRGKKLSLDSPLHDLPKASPLRQSFRNLLTVFNKAKKTFSDRPDENRETRNSNSPIGKGKIMFSNNSMSVGTLKAPEPAKPSISRLVPGLSPDIRNGVLLYYDKDSVPPVWHRCDAFLAPPNLRLDYFAPSGKPTTRTITITGGIDARSIASTNCAAITPPMLDGKPPQVLEIEFKGNVTEQFAATSVLERGGWISSIWDSIISSKARPSSQATITPDEKLFLSLPTFAPTKDIEALDKRDSSRQSEPLASIELAGSRASASLSARPSTQSTGSGWSTITGTLTGSPSVRTIEGMSIVKQQLARLGSAASASNASCTTAYATPPRTPAPVRGSLVSSSRLSRSNAIQRTASSVGCELASPRPVHAKVASFLSSTDTGSSYGDTSEVENRSPKRARIETQPPPVAEPDTAIKALPRGASPPVHERSLPLAPKFPHADERSRSLYTNQYPVVIPFHTTPTPLPTIDGLPKSSRDQQMNLNDLRNRISCMHREIKLAIKQPSLPVPQLDDLRDRLEALANGLHAADLQGLHGKVDQLKNRAEESILHNEAPSSSDDMMKKLDELTDTFNELRSKLADDTSSLPLIKERLAAIQEHMENEVPPQVPAKDEPSYDALLLLDNVGEIQKKIDNLESILVDLRKQGEDSKAAEPPASLSVFSKHGNADAFAPESNVAAPEAGAFGFQGRHRLTDGQILEILAFVKEGQQERGALTIQFEDSVRYLNELNKWMEAFVTKTGGQEQLLQTIVDVVGKMAQDPMSTMQNVAPDKQESRASVNAIEDLKTSMQTVLNAIGDDMRQYTEFKEAQGLTAVLAAIEKNQKEQESLLRGIAEGISVDIRGERLRFVDAMKDATSVNVANHLEEFKRQLSHEVMIMLQEVGKGARCRERNHLEREIGEIFSRQVERRQSMGLQALVPDARRSAPPSRPQSEGPYPAFMMHPVNHPMPHPSQFARPMALHPNVSGFQTRLLPTPSSSGAPTPQLNLDASQMQQPQRRKA